MWTLFVYRLCSTSMLTNESCLHHLGFDHMYDCYNVDSIINLGLDMHCFTSLIGT